MLDGLVDLVDGCAEAIAGQAVVAGEAVLERLQLLLEVAHVDRLLAHLFELLFVGYAVARGLGEQGDDGHEELRADNKHLGVTVRDIHDALVVELALGLKQGDKHGVFAAFLAAIFVELGEEILVAMLGSGGVGLVFHLEHDGDVLHAVDMVAEDEVALCASAGVVVLLEIGVGVDAATDAVELRAAMDLEALADHLGRHSGLQVLVIIHLLLLLLEAPLIVLLQGILADGGLFLLQFDLVLQLLALALGLLQSLPPSLLFLEHFELHSVVVAFDLSLQTVDLLFLARQLCTELQLFLLLHAV